MYWDATIMLYSSSDIRLFILQDLLFRQYLVTSNLDRHILHVICIAATIKSPEMNVTSLGTVNPADSCTLAGTYVRLLSPQPDTGMFNMVELDALGLIYQHVMTMLGKNISTQEEILPIAEISLNFLWAIFAPKSGALWRSDRSSRIYVSLIFGSIR